MLKIITVALAQVSPHWSPPSEPLPDPAPVPNICHLMPWSRDCDAADGHWDTCPDAPFPEMCDPNVVTVVENPDGSFRFCPGGPEWFACVFGQG